MTQQENARWSLEKKQSRCSSRQFSSRNDADCRYPAGRLGGAGDPLETRADRPYVDLFEDVTFGQRHTRAYSTGVEVVGPTIRYFDVHAPGRHQIEPQLPRHRCFFRYIIRTS